MIVSASKTVPARTTPHGHMLDALFSGLFLHLDWTTTISLSHIALVRSSYSVLVSYRSYSTDSFYSIFMTSRLCLV